MIATVALIYGVLALTGAALVKFLFTQRSRSCLRNRLGFQTTKHRTRECGSLLRKYGNGNTK
jgi:hypothetical protein